MDDLRSDRAKEKPSRAPRGSVQQIDTQEKPHMTFHSFAATRRALLALAVASTAALAVITSTPAHAAPPAQQQTQVPGYYRMALGDFEVTPLYDGYINLD